MDRLVNYIEYRWKKYGKIERTTALSSMYYSFGNIKVRISDHMKYSEDEVRKIDYFFIIQPNDTYVFMTSPKYNKDGKLYMKIVSYNEAKEFIKALHDYSMKLIPMTKWYSPIGWNDTQKYDDNTKVIKNNTDRMEWDNFYQKYFYMRDDTYKTKVAHRIESLVYGNIGKGTVSGKMDRIKNAYMKMSSSQYDTLMKKFIEANL